MNYWILSSLLLEYVMVSSLEQESVSCDLLTPLAGLECQKGELCVVDLL